MISKNKISEVRKLHLKKFREEYGLFLVEGRKCVEMLLESDFVLEELFATEASLASNSHMLAKCSPTMANASEMERMSTLSTSPDLLAVVRYPENSFTLQKDAPVLVLDRIADPGNLGTIIRTADWFNIPQIVCSTDCVDFYNPKTIQSTMGSFCHVQMLSTDLVPFLNEQRQSRRVLGTFLGGKSVYDMDFQKNDIIVIGSESHGIRPEVAALITDKVTIPNPNPGRPSAESLNAGIAAAIVMDRFSTSIVNTNIN